MTVKAYNNNCFEVLKTIPDASIDFILTDPPYGSIRCKWDVIIPFDEMWEQLNRIIKPNGAIALFGTEPFSTLLRNSNIEHYKYDWIWEKTRPTGFQHAKNKPMSITENISVFSKANVGHASQLGDNRMVYNPQGVESDGIKEVTKNKHGNILGRREYQEGKEYESFTGFPVNVLRFPSIGTRKVIHPTEKPVELLEYLVKTYSSEGETVLDFTAGSFSTGWACMNTNRNFIGIELSDEYFEKALRRLKAVNRLDYNDEHDIEICTLPK